MKSYEFTAKNIQDAIKKGLEELNVKQEDVDISILNEGGLFSKAKILINIEEEPIKELEAEKPSVKTTAKIFEETMANGEVVHNIEQTVSIQQIKKDFKDVLVEKQENSDLTETEQTAITEEIEGFLKELIKSIDENADLLRVEDDEKIMFNIRSEKAGSLIGYRGEGLKALQTIVSQIASNKNRNSKRVFVDVENYKARREQSLIELANRIAEKVERTGKWQKMEHLNAYERRAVHSALQTREKISTRSEGVEPRRILIIELKKDA